MLEKIPQDGVFSYEIRNAPMEKIFDRLMNFAKKHGSLLTFMGTVLMGSWWLHHSLAHLEIKIVEGLAGTNAVFSDKLGSLEGRLNEKIDSLRSDLHHVEKSLGIRIGAVEKDVAVIKTILIMKGHMPPEMAASSKPGQ